MADERKQMVKGAVVAAVTPATEDFDVDYERLRDQYRFLIEGGIREGVGVILAVGGGGEGYFLDTEQWMNSVKIFAEEAKGKVPTMVGVFELNAAHAVKKIRYAEDLGIDMVQLAPPHYEKPTDAEVFAYYKMVNDSIRKIGIVVYHTYWSLPEYYEMTAPVISRLADLKNVIGIKWASTSLPDFTQVLFGFRDRFAFVDNQGWTQTVGDPHGMQAFMFFRGNFDPPAAAEIGKLFLAGDHKAFVQKVSEKMAFRGPLNREILAEVHGPNSPERKTLGEGTLAKATMDIFDRPMGPAFPPQHNLSEETKARVKKEIGR